MVEHANIIASVGQPKLIENVARSVGNDNNGLHTEPFLGRTSMLCFLYGPGEPGRYPATHDCFSDGKMNQTDNPFQSPKNGGNYIRDGGTNWRSGALFNASVLGALALLIALSATWSWFQSAQMEQSLGRRYASYDHEYSVHINWATCAVMVGGIFAIANIVFFTLAPLFRTKRPADSSQNE